MTLCHIVSKGGPDCLTQVHSLGVTTSLLTHLTHPSDRVKDAALWVVTNYCIQKAALKDELIRKDVVAIMLEV